MTMQHLPPYLPGPSAQAAQFRLRRGLVTLVAGLPMLLLAACGPSRDELLAESLAEARAAAARAEKAQKAAELALAKLRGAQPQAEESEAAEEDEVVDGDEPNDDGPGEDSDAEAANSDGTQNNGEVVPAPQGAPRRVSRTSDEA